MSRLFAFLRAINVGGRTVTIAALREHFEALGFKGVETFIASGNVIFDYGKADLEVVRRKIETGLQKRLGYEVRTFLRTEVELKAIAQYKPFTESQVRDAEALNVAFLAEPLSAAARKSLMALKTDIDDFHLHGREMYWLCKQKQSDSKFSNSLFERKVGVSATFRGVGTMAKLAAKYLD